MTAKSRLLEAQARNDGLSYPFDGFPGPGEAREVADGVYWVRMQLPFQLDHINLYVLRDGDGWVVVDTGVNTSETKDLWCQIIEKYFGGGPIKRVFVTHLHPDHVGLAGWFTREHDIDLWMTRTDYLMCKTLVLDTGREAPPEGLRFYKAAGFNERQLNAYAERFGGFGSAVYQLPDAFRRIVDGQTLEFDGRVWQVVVGRGHAPEHACLWCPELAVMISGDQILPRISSNVSLFPTEPDGNPLGEWIESCRKLHKMMPPATLVLPAHNEPFTGVRQRLKALVDGHEDGLMKLRDMCTEPKRAIDVFPALFKRKITSATFFMATGESLAHLNCLIHRGEMICTRDEDGVDWYRTI